MRTGVCIALAAIWAFSAAFAGAQAQSQRPPVLMNSIIVPESEFSVPQLEARFREVIAKQGSEFRLVRVEVFTSEQARLNSAKYGSDVTYENWAEWYRDYKIPPEAELLVISGNAAMRVRDLSGHLTFRVLAGSDPYTSHVGQSEFHILHLAASDSAPLASTQPLHGKNGELKYVLTLHFYVVAGSVVREQDAKAFTELLRHVSQVDEISVLIRRDPWFITADLYFPIVSPFAIAGDPPTREEYEHSQECSCRTRAAGTTCVVYGDIVSVPASRPRRE